jgi:hypothetical protein
VSARVRAHGHADTRAHAWSQTTLFALITLNTVLIRLRFFGLSTALITLITLFNFIGSDAACVRLAHRECANRPIS